MENDTVVETKILDQFGNLIFENTMEFKRVQKIKIKSPNGLCFIDDVQGIFDENTGILECSTTNDKSILEVALSEVVVIGNQKVIEDKGDKIIYNVSKDTLISNLNAADVLRRAPLISVDASGMPSMRGSSNVIILINGKRVSGLTSSQVLSQIPSSEIISIEIITAPSVKYDSEGSSGAINIITKKKINLKTSGNLGLGVGTAGSHIYANYHYKLKDSSSLATSFSSLIYYPKLSSNFSIKNQNNPFEEFDLSGINKGSVYYYSLGYSKEKKTGPLDISFDYYFSRERTTEEGTSQSQASINSNIDNSYQYFRLKSERTVNFNSSEKLEFSTGISYLPLQNTSLISAQSQNNTSSVTNFFVSTDFIFKPKKKLELSLGAKVDLDFIKGENRIESSEIDLQNNYSVRQQLTSFYTELNYRINNRSKLIAGIRNEGYIIYADDSILQDLSSFFYTLSFNRKFSGQSTFSINLFKRIERPQLINLLPVIFNVNPFVSNVGNPNLSPGFSYTLDFGFSKYIGDTFLKLSPFVTVTENKISNFLQYVDSSATILGSPINLKNSINYGSTLWVTTKFLKKRINLNYGFDVIYKRLAHENIKNSGFQFLNKINTSFKVSDKLQVNFFGSFVSRDILVQGFKNSYTYSNLSLQNKFTKNLSISLSLDNPFRKGFKSIESYELNSVKYSSEQLFFDRAIRIFASYKFGDSNKSKINNQQPDRKGILN